jgi:stage V sporulation protein S
MSNALDLSLDEIISKEDKRKPRRKNQSRRGRGKGRTQSRRNGNQGGRGYNKAKRRNKNGKSRFKPYEHISGGSIEDIALGDPESRALKVSGDSEVKKVAGAIAHCVRIGGAPPALMCTGALAINQAIKSLAIARTYLLDDEEDEDGETTDLICQPQFDGDSDKCVLRLRMSRPINMDMDYEELRTSPNSEPHIVAGAIAGKIRDDERVGIVSVGSGAVLNAVKSIFISRRYLKEDRIDVKFTPSFTKVTLPGRDEMNGILFSTLSRYLN